MAEYIEKKHLGREFQIEMLLPKTQTIIDTQMIIDNLPTADVVERSKIDKAIEEISEYASIWTNYTMDMSKEDITAKCLNDCKAQFLDILKRNIGEQNN